MAALRSWCLLATVLLALTSTHARRVAVVEEPQVASDSKAWWDKLANVPSTWKSSLGYVALAGSGGYGKVLLMYLPNSTKHKLAIKVSDCPDATMTVGARTELAFLKRLGNTAGFIGFVDYQDLIVDERAMRINDQVNYFSDELMKWSHGTVRSRYPANASQPVDRYEIDIGGGRVREVAAVFVRPYDRKFFEAVEVGHWMKYYDQYLHRWLLVQVEAKYLQGTRIKLDIRENTLGLNKGIDVTELLPVYRDGESGQAQMRLLLEGATGFNYMGRTLIDLQQVLESGVEPAVTLKFQLDAMQGLAFMHSLGYVHNDMKGQNILITRNRGVVADLGMVCDPKGEVGPISCKSMTLCGTPGYFSPEALQHKERTGKTDVYALGIMTWHALLGRRPKGWDGEKTVQQKIAAQVEFIKAPLLDKLKDPSLAGARFNNKARVESMLYYALHPLADHRLDMNSFIKLLEAVVHFEFGRQEERYSMPYNLGTARAVNPGLVNPDLVRMRQSQSRGPSLFTNIQEDFPLIPGWHDHLIPRPPPPPLQPQRSFVSSSPTYTPGLQQRRVPSDPLRPPEGQAVGRQSVQQHQQQQMQVGMTPNGAQAQMQRASPVPAANVQGNPYPAANVGGNPYGGGHPYPAAQQQPGGQAYVGQAQVGQAQLGQAQLGQAQLGLPRGQTGALVAEPPPGVVVLSPVMVPPGMQMVDPRMGAQPQQQMQVDPRMYQQYAQQEEAFVHQFGVYAATHGNVWH